VQDPSQNDVYSSAVGGIDPGFYTGSAGFWGYNEFCEKMEKEESLWTFKRVQNNERILDEDD